MGTRRLKALSPFSHLFAFCEFIACFGSVAYFAILSSATWSNISGMHLYLFVDASACMTCNFDLPNSFNLSQTGAGTWFLMSRLIALFFFICICVCCLVQIIEIYWGGYANGEYTVRSSRDSVFRTVLYWSVRVIYIVLFLSILLSLCDCLLVFLCLLLRFFPIYLSFFLCWICFTCWSHISSSTTHFTFACRFCQPPILARERTVWKRTPTLDGGSFPASCCVHCFSCR